MPSLSIFFIQRHFDCQFRLITQTFRRMMSALSYNLTEYTDFRKLQFEYCRVKDQNSDLTSKLETMEQLYRESIKEFQNKKLQWFKEQANLKARSLESEQKWEEIVTFSDNIKVEVRGLAKMGIDVGVDFQSQLHERLDEVERVKWIFNQMLKSMMFVLSNSNDIHLKYEREISVAKQDGKQQKRREKDLKDEVAYLSQQITKLQRTTTALLEEIGVLKRQNMDYKMQLYQLSKLQQERFQQKVNSDEHIEDNNFALDLLNYEKDVLQRIFAKILSSIQNQNLNDTLTDIYATYEKVTQAYREKLQIQYDLQDLQREYKREKSGKVGQNLLIQLRKQIEQFRKQLQKQKEVLTRQQQSLQSNFILLQSTDRQQHKLRSYTVQIQKKLKDIHSYNQTKRNSQDSYQQKQSSSRIHFRPTGNTQDVMREMVKKDRENIQKIFKQTRSNYLKNNKI